MKKILMLVWCILVWSIPLYASHIDLNKATKLEFVQKRLAMMKTQLALKLRQALLVNSAQLNEEIARLKKAVPLTQNSLKALQRS